jgi:hypothetical protein
MSIGSKIGKVLLNKYTLPIYIILVFHFSPSLRSFVMQKLIEWNLQIAATVADAAYQNLIAKPLAAFTTTNSKGTVGVEITRVQSVGQFRMGFVSLDSKSFIVQHVRYFEEFFDSLHLGWLSPSVKNIIDQFSKTSFYMIADLSTAYYDNEGILVFKDVWWVPEDDGVTTGESDQKIDKIQGDMLQKASTFFIFSQTLNGNSSTYGLISQGGTVALGDKGTKVKWRLEKQGVFLLRSSGLSMEFYPTQPKSINEIQSTLFPYQKFAPVEIQLTVNDTKIKTGKTNFIPIK